MSKDGERKWEKMHTVVILAAWAEPADKSVSMATLMPMPANNTPRLANPSDAEWESRT